jgi:hypothetical protein
MSPKESGYDRIHPLAALEILSIGNPTFACPWSSFNGAAANNAAESCRNVRQHRPRMGFNETAANNAAEGRDRRVYNGR